MRSITIIFCVILALLSFQQAQARIIHVPAEQSTIQVGINVSLNGDTVLVAPGTYYEHINFNGKAILVKSETGAENTIINKLNDGYSIVIFNSGETNSSTIDGFTIQNANKSVAGHGGGIYCIGSSPTIRNNILKQNFAGCGGGIDCQGQCSPVIENNLLIGNTASWGGGAIYCELSCSASISWNFLIQNSAVYNSAIGYSSASGTFSHNLLIENRASGGATIGCYDNSSPLIVNNTLDRNYSGATWGSIACNKSSSPQIKNTIITNELEGNGISAIDNSFPIITYCDVWNNALGGYYGCTPGAGCISADPMFCDTLSDNYCLFLDSPCLGTGEGGVDIGAFSLGCGKVTLTPGPNQLGPANSQVSVIFYIQSVSDSTDTFDLNVSDALGWNITPTYEEMILAPDQLDSISLTVSIPNATTGTVDRITLTAMLHEDSVAMGKASLTVTVTPRTIYVPYEQPTIQAGINASGPGDTLLVAPGTYYEHIFFNGKPILLKSEKGRDSTIISKIAGGISMVSFVSGEDSNSVLDGFTITGGNLESGQGAGIRCQNASPNILNNRIINNISPLGAGIDCDNYSSPRIAYNLIENNTATSQGAGIRCNNHSSPVILGNAIVGNLASESGAGILCLNYCSPTITENRITADTAQNSGGGMLFDGHCSPTITGNLIAGNVAQTGYGGGITFLNSSIGNISNNTVDRNIAWKGGGIFLDNTSNATILNNAVTNSLAGKGIRAEGPYPTIIYCDVWNNLNENYYGCIPGEGCISADPLFCSSGNGNYYLWIASPCIGSGQGGANIGAFGVGCSTFGDANGDGVINSADVSYLINYLFVNGPAPQPWQAGDSNCDGTINSADVAYLINYLFIGGPPPCEP